MSILVAYFSRSGNTKKVAESIFGALPGEKSLSPIEKIGDLKDFRIIFIGFPVHSHTVPFPVEEFLKKIPRGTKIALFSTHGSFTGSRLSREAIEYAATTVSQAELLGSFSCRGEVSDQAIELLSRSSEHKGWAEMSTSARSHPDEHDLKEAQDFAKWILTLAAQR
ncbi:flavodoxin family protein [Acidobacteriota bacterium]